MNGARRLIVGREVAARVARAPPEDVASLAVAARDKVPVALLRAHDLERELSWRRRDPERRNRARRPQHFAVVAIRRGWSPLEPLGDRFDECGTRETTVDGSPHVEATLMSSPELRTT